MTQHRKEVYANMKQILYWKKFAESGNVFDYLEYKQAEKRKKRIEYENNIDSACQKTLKAGK